MFLNWKLLCSQARDTSFCEGEAKAEKSSNLLRALYFMNHELKPLLQISQFFYWKISAAL